MLALTLWPEWAWAICHAGKRVENRAWHPGKRLPVGSRLAIHAGKHIGGRPGQTARDEGLDALFDMGFGSLSFGWEPEVVACPRSAIVAVATVEGFDQEQRTQWDVPGCWHWRLSGVLVLAEPVACRGAQGLWTAHPTTIGDSPGTST